MRNDEFLRMVEILSQAFKGQERRPQADKSGRPPPHKAKSHDEPIPRSPKGLALLGLLEGLTPRELFWWRVCGLKMEDQPGTIGHARRGDVPVLVFGKDFWRLDQAEGIRILKQALADSEKLVTG